MGKTKKAERLQHQRRLRAESFRTLLRIVQELDAQPWTPDTLDRIAGILRAAGYEIRDVEIPRCPDCTSALTDRTHLEDGTPTYCDECDREVRT